MKLYLEPDQIALIRRALEHTAKVDYRMAEMYSSLHGDIEKSRAAFVSATRMMMLDFQLSDLKDEDEGE